MKDILERDLARAEAVLHQAQHGRKKLHGPTVHNFNGQAIAYKRALTLLELERITPRGPIEVHRHVTINIPVTVLAIVAACGIMLWFV
jgi:hypothetical protein